MRFSLPAWLLHSGLVGNLGSSNPTRRMWLDHVSGTYFLSYSFQTSLLGIGFHFAVFLDMMLALFGTPSIPCGAFKNNVCGQYCLIGLVLLVFQYLPGIGQVLWYLCLDLGVICQDLFVVGISAPIFAYIQHCTPRPWILCT